MAILSELNVSEPEKMFFLKMEESLILISDRQAQGDNVNTTLIRQRAERIFSSLKASHYWCLPKRTVAHVYDFPGTNFHNMGILLPISVISLAFVVSLSTTLLRNQLTVNIEEPLAKSFLTK